MRQYGLPAAPDSLGEAGSTSGSSDAATGTGLANLDPQALSVNVAVGCSGVRQVTVRVDGNHAWMIIGGSSDPSGPPSSAGRQWAMYDLVSYQGTVDLCFGPELGALATIGMASPEGQLALSQQAIAGATPAGTITVNGEPATEYQVEIDPAGFLQQANSTPAEDQAIAGALRVIGNSPVEATVAVDGDGYIVEMVLSVDYPDGVTATHTIELSNFGSAGTIQLPPIVTPPASFGGCGPDEPSCQVSPPHELP